MHSLDHEALLHAAHVQNPFCPEEILALHAKQNRQPAGDGIAVKRGVLLVMFVLFFVVSSVELFVEGDAVGAFVVLGVDAEEGLVALPSEAAAVGRERAGVEDLTLYRGRVVTGSHPAALAPWPHSIHFLWPYSKRRWLRRGCWSTRPSRDKTTQAL